MRAKGQIEVQCLLFHLGREWCMQRPCLVIVLPSAVKVRKVNSAYIKRTF